jgi:hypothetical protein
MKNLSTVLFAVFVGGCKGAWVMSHSKHLQIALNDAFFQKLGLVRVTP